MGSAKEHELIPREHAVSAWKAPAGATYPLEAPYHPSIPYPEIVSPLSVRSGTNLAYSGVRECLRLARLDESRFGEKDWNPLGELIRPGETVLLKPNWVKADHPREGAGVQDGWRCVVTHPSIVRALADYCFLAVGRTGRVVVADAPQTDSSWRQLHSTLGLQALMSHYEDAGFDFSVIDLRKEEWVARDGVIVERRRLPGDPLGYAAVDLGAMSEFAEHSGAGRYYGADYDDAEVNRHHRNGRHEYLVSRTALAADVVFSVPKIKTHKKTGITVGLKNLVGVNGDKNWLPHHTEPSWLSPGDERPSDGGWSHAASLIERKTARAVRHAALAFPGIGKFCHAPLRSVGTGVFGSTERTTRSGNWWGNDTCWRMCLDLNKLVFYSGPDGVLRQPGPAGRRRYFVLADGLIAGHRDGPMDPDPIWAGLLLFGTHPASVDAASAVLMGFDPERIPVVRQAFRCREFPLAEWDWRAVVLNSNSPAWNGALATIPAGSCLSFVPHFGWVGEVEAGLTRRCA